MTTKPNPECLEKCECIDTCWGDEFDQLTTPGKESLEKARKKIHFSKEDLWG